MSSNYAAVVITLLCILATMSSLLTCTNTWASESLGQMFNMKKQDLYYGLLTVTIEQNINSLMREHLAKRANDNPGSRIAQVFKWKDNENISLAKLAEWGCAPLRAGLGLVGNTCMGPTIKFWTSLIVFLLILANVSLLFGAAGLYWHYFWKHSRKQKRILAKNLVVAAAIVMWSAVLIYALGSMEGIRLNFQMLFMMYSSQGGQPTSLRSAYLMLVLLTLAETVVAAVLAAFPVFHPEELMIQDREDGKGDYFEAYASNPDGNPGYDPSGYGAVDVTGASGYGAAAGTGFIQPGGMIQTSHQVITQQTPMMGGGAAIQPDWRPNMF